MAGRNNSPDARRARAKLVDRDYDILEHLKRYRLTVRETLRDELFEGSELNAVSKVTSRLEDGGFLRSHPLDEKRKYWTFGPEACALFGVPPQKSQPLGPQALVEELGTLLFCLGGATRRHRLTVAEVGRLFPGVAAAKLRSSRYYLDYGADDAANAQPRLGLIRVDGGGPPAHVVRKLVQDVDKRREVPAARALIADRPVRHRRGHGPPGQVRRDPRRREPGGGVAGPAAGGRPRGADAGGLEPAEPGAGGGGLTCRRLKMASPN